MEKTLQTSCDDAPARASREAFALGPSLRRAWLALPAAALVALAVGGAIRQGWTGDFWEHAAVVRAFAENASHPSHPLLGGHAPHAFQTPYHLVVGLCCRWTGAGPVATLGYAAIANALLLVYASWSFVKRTMPWWSSLAPRHAASVWSLFLAATLLAWAPSAWRYSGFFHASNAAAVLSYPSAFATSLTFLLLSGIPGICRQPRPVQMCLWLLGAATLVLTHPITAVGFAAGAVGLVVGAPAPIPLLRRALPLGLLALCVPLCFLWPYFPFLDLLRTGTAAFHTENRDLYVEPLARLGPALVGILPLALAVRRQGLTHAGLVALALLLALYVLAWATERWAYGRVIAAMANVSHLAIAAGLVGAMARLGERRPGLQRAAALLLAAAAMLQCWGHRFAMQTFTLQAPPVIERLAKLKDHVGHDDVILADLDLSRLIPAITGHVVATPNPLAFVTDEADRRQEIRTFFAKSTPPAARAEIVRRRSPAWILLDRRAAAPTNAIIRQFSGSKPPIAITENLVLVSVGTT